MEVLPSLGSAQLESFVIPSFDYDECLSFKSLEYEEFPQISAQYCWVGASYLLPKPEQYKKEPIPDWAIELWGKSLMAQNKMDYEHNTRLSEPDIKNLPRNTLEVIFLMDYFRPLHDKLNFGLCMPRSCNPQDMEDAINKGIYIK